MHPPFPRFRSLLPAMLLAFGGCAMPSEGMTVEALLQPPAFFCDLSAATPDGGAATGKKAEQP